MTKAPVAELVCENCHDLLGLALLDEGVVDDDVLLPWQTKEVGVAVCASLASINNVELLEGEVEALSQALDAGLKCTRIQRRELVEEWQDGDGVDGDHENLEGGAEEPEVVEELVARLLDDLEEPGEDGRGKDECQHLRFQDVGNEELGCLLVEAELLLQDKCAIN